MKSNFWTNLFLILVGIVLGTMVAYFAEGTTYFSWLSFGRTFGTTAPLSVDLGIISFTVGVSVNLTVAVILLTALSLAVGKFIINKR